MDGTVILSLVGVVVALVVLIIGIYRGYTPVVMTVISAVIIALTSGMPVMDFVLGTYAGGVADMIKVIYLILVSACLISEVCDKVGSTAVLGNAIGKLCGPKHAAIAVLIGMTLCAYGGLGLGGHLIMFNIGLGLFKKGNYSKYLLPACVIAGAWSYAMTGPFSVDSMNYLPTLYFGTTTRACLVPGLIGAVAIFLLSAIYLERRSIKMAAKGQVWEADTVVPEDPTGGVVTAGGVIKALIPLLVTFASVNLFELPIAVATLLGAFAFTILNFTKFKPKEWLNIYCKGALDGVQPSIDMAAIAGFAACVTVTPFYQWFVNSLTSMNANPYLLAMVIPGIIATLMASGTNAVVISLEGLSPFFLSFASQGYSMGAIHRLLSMSAGVLDSLPTNGSINSLLRLWDCPYEKSYWPIFVVTSIIPFIGMLITFAFIMLGFG